MIKFLPLPLVLAIVGGCATTVGEQETVPLRQGGDADARIVQPGLLQTPEQAFRERAERSVAAHGAEIGGVTLGIETTDGRTLNFTMRQHQDGTVSARTQPSDSADDSMCEMEFSSGPEDPEIGRAIEWCKQAIVPPPSRAGE